MQPACALLIPSASHRCSVGSPCLIFPTTILSSGLRRPASRLSVTQHPDHSMMDASTRSLTRTSTVTSSGADEPTIVRTFYPSLATSIDIIKRDFRILSEILPAVYLLTGDNQSTTVYTCDLEVSLVGTLILAERFGSCPWRCLTWLWQHGLRRHSSTVLQITGDGPDIRRGGLQFVISGCKPEVTMHESALKKRLSGRMMIRQWTKQPPLSFLWDEVRRFVVRTS